MASDACSDCRHYVAPGTPGEPGLCLHVVRRWPMYPVNTCDEWEELMPDEPERGEAALVAGAERNGDRARLESDVVQAALAERRAALAYYPMDTAWIVRRREWDADIERAYDDATESLRNAVDALLAHLGED